MEDEFLTIQKTVRDGKTAIVHFTEKIKGNVNFWLALQFVSPQSKCDLVKSK